jgi:hypothetical protein
MSWETVSERASFFDPETLTVTYVVYETQISSSFGFSDFLKKNLLQLTTHLENGLPAFRYNPRLIYFLNSS